LKVHEAREWTGWVRAPVESTNPVKEVRGIG
jgi:hypothetical protein